MKDDYVHIAIRMLIIAHRVKNDDKLIEAETANSKESRRRFSFWIRNL